MSFRRDVWREVESDTQHTTAAKVLGSWIAGLLAAAGVVLIWEAFGLTGLAIAAALRLAIAVFAYAAFKEAA